MGLPFRFRNVNYYRIAGKYTFSGDLFIARNTIYFFPEVDLAEQRENVTSVLPHNLALLALALLYIRRNSAGPIRHVSSFGGKDYCLRTLKNTLLFISKTSKKKEPGWGSARRSHFRCASVPMKSQT